MEKKCKMHLNLCLFIVLFSAACKKNNQTPDQVEDTSAIVVVPQTPAPPVPPVIVPSYEVGTGSGYLTIDGSSLDLSTIKLIKIKGGSYKGIYIKNIAGTVAAPITIKNNGQVVITEGMETDNAVNVAIEGDANPDIKYGFSFENIALRAIKLNKRIEGVTFKSMSFKNVLDYCIAGEKSNGEIAYDGSAGTRNERLKILNCRFDNAGSIVFNGALDNQTSTDVGLFKDVEIAYNDFSNTNAGTLCSFGNVQDYNIHHNTVNNVNPTNNNHNGIFYMQGNGNFHDNKLTNYQGNSIRMWLYSRGGSPATVQIYNNICYNTRKYGGFEIQGFDRYIYPGKSTFANAKVYNNTVGRMNTSKDWEGQVLDLYNYGGTLEFYNNLGFDLVRVNLPVSGMINNMSNTKITVESNNKYTTAQQDAVIDLNSFTSKFSGIGAPSF